MKTITVRNMPRELAKEIDRRARAGRTSLSKTVVVLLEEATGLGHRKPERTLHDDLDDLAGSWSREEADAFDRVLAEQRTIDPELWK
jgi:hypothetical protein